MKRMNPSRGFTLVELLVVVLILAILMAVALPLYLGAIASSERGAARANMQTIANANQSFRLTKGHFTDKMTDLVPDLGSATLQGPGTRQYKILLIGSCDHDADAVTDDAVIPEGGFAVQSTEPSDGCFIPGLSTK